MYKKKYDDYGTLKKNAFLRHYKVRGENESLQILVQLNVFNVFW